MANEEATVSQTVNTVTVTPPAASTLSVTSATGGTLTSPESTASLVAVTVAPSTASLTIESKFAPKHSPVLTGAPLAPTASAGTNNTQIATTQYVTTAVTNLIDAAPNTLDTLNEIAEALNDDASFHNTITNLANSKLSLSGGTMTGNITMSGSQTVDGRDLSVDGAKLDGIEASATADQTAAEIRTLVESASDSNVFTDADHSKLNAIEASATADQTASEILTLIKTVDGASSGLDADLLDGSHASTFAPLASPALTGTPTAPTANAGTDTTQVATTAFVNAAVALENTLAEMDDVVISSLANGELLQYNSGLARWINATPTEAGILPLAGGTMTGALTVGVDDTGHDVKFFGATSGSYMLWDESTDDLILGGAARLGIGTTSPARKLEVSEGSSSIVAQFKSTSGTSAFITLANTTATADQIRVGSIGNDLVLSTNYAERMRILSDGKVGIGSTSPVAKLYVKENNATTPAVQFYQENTDGRGLLVQTESQLSNRYALKVESTGSSTNLFYVAADGNVGIGGLPTQKLSVIGGHIELDDNRHIQWGGSNNRITGNDASDYIRVFTAGNEVARFNASGNLGIGTASPASLLDVRGTVQVGVDDTGHDVKFFGATSGKYMLWDESDDILKFPDSTEINLGTGGDLRIYHDGTNNYIKSQNSADLYIHQGANDKDIIFECDDGSGGVETYFYLDGSASSGNPKTKFPDNSRLGFGADADLYLYHDGSHSYMINDVGHLYIRNQTDDNDIIFQCDDGSGGTETYFRLDGSFSGGDPYTVFPDNSNLVLGTGGDLHFNHDGTNSSIKNHTGDLVIEQNADDKDIIFKGDNGSGGTETYFRLDGSLSSGSPYTVFPDSSYLALGTGADLRIYHDGTNSWLNNATGDLKIRNASNDKDIIFQCDDGAGAEADYFILDGSSATHDGSATTSLYTYWPDNSIISLGSSKDFSMYHTGTKTLLNNSTGNLEIRNSADDGDIIFQSDDGSGGTETYFRLDGSASSGDPFTVFPDNSIASFGDAKDLRIFHNGTDSHIQNLTGDLRITNYADDSDIIFSSDDGSGGTEIYFRLDGSASSGNPITNFPDNSFLSFGSSHDFSIYHDSTNTYIANSTNDLYIQNNADNADIIFRSDDGSGGVAEYFRLDGALSHSVVSKHIRFGDNVIARFGDGNDASLYHTGTDTIFENTNGDLYIKNHADDKDIIFQSDDGSGSVTTYFRLDGSFGGAGYPTTLFPQNSSLRFGNSGNLQIINNGTDSYIQENNGDLYIRQSTDDKDIIFQSDDGSGGVATYITIDGSAVLNKFWKDTKFVDGVKALFGDGGDLQIYHDGSNSYIRDESGTGDLIISTNAFRLKSANNGETMMTAFEDGAANLYHNNVQKFETTSAGATITGDLTVGDSHFIGDDSFDNLALISSSGENLVVAAANDIYLNTDASGGGTGTNRVLINESGATFSGAVTVGVDDTGHDVKFFGATAGSYMLWDESADKLILNEASLQIVDATPNIQLYDSDTANQFNIDFNGADVTFKAATPDGDIIFQADNGSGGLDSYLRIDGGAHTLDVFKQTHFYDSVKATFGTGNDLQIYHDGTHSYIDNSSTFLILESDNIILRNNAGDEDYAKFLGDGAVELYHNDVKKFETTAAGATVTGNLTVSADLIINGTTTTVNSTTVTIDDPVFTLGGDSAPSSDDNKDRGIEFRYHNGSAAKIGFFGWDDSASVFTFIADASPLSEVYSGSAGNVAFGNIAGTLTTAAQGNITSLGTLTTLTVDDITINGSTISDGGAFSLDVGADITFDAGGGDIILSDDGTIVGTLSMNQNGGDFEIRSRVSDKDLVFKGNDGGSEITALTIDMSEGGNVGIGTTSPSDKLHVEGKIRIGTTPVIHSHDTITIDIDSNNNQSTNYFRVTKDGEATELMRVQEDGKVGIGTVNPAELLHVEGSNATINVRESGAATVKMRAGSVGRIGTYSDNDFSIVSNSTDQVRIKSNGKVGIGTTSPASFLDVRGTVQVGVDDTGHDVKFYGATSGRYLLWDESADALRLTDWTPLYLGAGNDLQLYHDGTNSNIINTNGDLTIQNSADDKDIIFQCDDGSGGVETYFYLDGSSGGSAPFTVFPDGSNLTFGDGFDLRILHNATDSHIANYGGNLYLTNYADDKDIIFQSDDGSGGTETYFFLDGSYGSGTYNWTSFPDNSIAAFGDGKDLRLFHNGTDSFINNNTGDLNIVNLASDKDILFKADDGSGGVETYFYLDGSSSSGDPYTKFPDNSILGIGDSADLKIFHNATNTFIENNTGDLFIKNGANDKDILFQCDDGSGGTETYFYLDGSASSGNPITIFPDNSYLQFGTGMDLGIVHNGTNALISNTTGNIKFTNYADDADIKFECDDGSGGVTEYFRVDGGATNILFSKELRLLDGVQIQLGTGNDFQVFHNGSNGAITNNTGNLIIKNNTDDGDIIFESDDGSGGIAEYFRLDGGLGYSIASKQITFQDSISAAFGTGNDLGIDHNGTDSRIFNYTGDLYISNFANDKDIIFQSDDGSGGVATYITIDGSASYTKIHKTFLSLDNVLHYYGSDADSYMRHTGTNFEFINTTGDTIIRNDADDKDIIFQSDDGSGGIAEYFRLDGGLGYLFVSKTLNFADNVPATFGPAGDLNIRHDGTDSSITNNTGDLYVRNTADDKDIIFKADAGGTEAEIMRIDGSTGRVGIGATSPDSALELEVATAGSTQTRCFHIDHNPTGNTGSGYMTIRSGTNVYSSASLEQVSSGGGSLYGTYSDTNLINHGTQTSGAYNNINFVTNEAIRMTIGGGTQAGNIGIGTTSPSAKLHVAGGNILVDLQYGIRFADANTRIYTNAETPEDLIIEADQDLLLTPDNNVGIGTTSPSDKLHVEGKIRIGTTPVIHSHDTITIDIDSNNNQSTNYFRVTKDGEATELMRVQEDGNVGIGTTSPASPLSVVGSARIDGSSGDGVFTIANSAGSQSLRFDQNSIRTTTNNNLTFLTNGNSNSLVLEQANNRVGIGTASPSEKLHVSGNARIGNNTTNGHLIGRKDYSVTQTFSTGLTVTLADHTACHVKVFISGDWSNHSSIAYVGEFFIQNTGNVGSYNEPGIILTEHDNLTTDGILSQIVDGTSDSFEIQFRANTSSATSVSGRLCYHVMGDASAVS